MFTKPSQLYQFIDNLSFDEYKERLNKCIATFNRVLDGGILFDKYDELRKEKLLAKIHYILNFKHS